MTYERYDAGPTQTGVRHTAPNVDRVMGLGSTQETTVDRLLTVVERLTAELATTQSALHDLALEVARAGIGSGRGSTAPPAGYGTGVSAIATGTVPLASSHPSALPPRRSDHAVIPEIDTYSPGRHADPEHPSPVHDGAGTHAAQTTHAAFEPDGAPADQQAQQQPQAETPLVQPTAQVAPRPTASQQRAAEASA
ncbi:hypothetical protein, partial [Patulibacter sp.]|uniref:hypothetical protein n=1 Tax=Patulibacter sp. TaxID=1912859 RepID=UPI0027237072